MSRRHFLVLIVWLGATETAAEPPSFGLPVDCEIGETCFIQNHVDHDPGEGRRDYACGRLTYDGHDGTDFRLRDVLEMRRGVAALAAAAGTVRATRDGMPDISVAEIGAEAIRGYEAGNGIVIDHGGGWETQYSHLRRGSVAVRGGDRVEAGTPIGLIGLSGSTEFPHVEFSVRYEGDVVDPFVGSGVEAGCGGPRSPLWSPEAQRVLSYRPTGLLVAGFSEAAPNAEAARRGAFRLGGTVRDPAALVLWVDLFGAQQGDVQRFTIEAPDGSIFFDQQNVLDRSNVSWFAFSGRRRPPDGWRPGAYTGRYQLTRDGAPVVDHEQKIVVAP